MKRSISGWTYTKPPFQLQESHQHAAVKYFLLLQSFLALLGVSLSISLGPELKHYLRVVSSSKWCMRGQILEDWQKLCQLTVFERNPDRLMALIREIDRLLAEKEGRRQRHKNRTGEKQA